MAIGIGGMIGAGIFSILGVVAQAAGTAMWLSFVIGGAVALLSTYSYAKLGARYPSAGGAVEFLVKGFGDGVLSGGINLYMWIGYVIALALYAQGFVGYAMTFVPPNLPAWLPKAIGCCIVLVFTGVNLIGAKVVGRSETFIVVVKLLILFLFAGAGLFFIQPKVLGAGIVAPRQWDSLWSRGSLHRVRGFRIGGKCRGRHGRSPEITAKGPVYERNHCDPHLRGGIGGRGWES